LLCYIFALQFRALLCPKKRKLCKGKCKGERSSKCWPIKGVGRVRIRNRICFRFMRGTWWQGREPNAPVELPVTAFQHHHPRCAYVSCSPSPSASPFTHPYWIDSKSWPKRIFHELPAGLKVWTRLPNSTCKLKEIC